MEVMCMKAMRCVSCGCHLEAAEDKRLCEFVEDHLKHDHQAKLVEREVIRQIVAAHAFKMEYAMPYAGTTAPDEEFGLEPY